MLLRNKNHWAWQKLKAGQLVSVVSDVSGGEQAVGANLRLLNDESVAIDRVSVNAGDICVHVSRPGYQIQAV